MKNCEARDRLSELPDSLIFHIFWFLPMRDVVRTTMLSRRWNNLWKTATCLNFEDCKKATGLDTVRNFINRALMFWKGTGLQKFKIDFGTPELNFQRLLFNEIDLWVCYAKENQVEELHVDLENRKLANDGAGAIKMIEEGLYWAPQCLYSCSSLQKLFIKGCNLHIPIKNVVNWNRLRDLRIYGYGLSEDLINQVLSGSPQLEVLILSFVENREGLSIQSSSLKHLFIEKYLYYVNDDSSLDTELRISAPNLEKLGILGVPYSKCLMNAPTIQHAEEVVLSDWCIKFVVGAMKEEYMVSPFLNANFLEIKVSSQEYEQIVDILEICPNLKKLVMFPTYKSVAENAKSCIKLDRNRPDSFLQRLRTVDVTWTKGDNAVFPLIQILLKYANASKLEKMVFQEKIDELHISWESSFIAAQKFAENAKILANCRVDFLLIFDHAKLGMQSDFR